MGIKSLTDLEFSRFHNALPGIRGRRGLLSSAYVLLPLTGSFYLFRGHESPQMLLAVASLGLLALIMLMSLFHMMAFWGQPQKEWWLTFPYPRESLIYAKTIAFLRIAWRAAVIVGIVSAGHYAIAVSAGLMKPMSAAELALSGGAHILFTAVAIPVTIAFGFAVNTLYSGKAVWGIIPYILLLQAPTILIGMLFAADDGPLTFLSPSHVLWYTLCIAVIGWPLAYLLLRLAADVGFKRMSDSRYWIKPAAGKQAAAQAKHRDIHREGAFRSLYRLERTRFIHYGSLRGVRIAVYVFLAAFAIGAFFSVHYLDSILEMTLVLFMLPVLTANIWTMNFNAYEMQKKRLQWWLSFPYSRSLLILSRLTAVWVTMMKYMLALSAAFWIGSAAGLLVHPDDAVYMGTVFTWFCYSALVYTTLLTVTMGALQATYFFMRTTWTSVLLAPLYFLVAFESWFMNRYFYPETFDQTAGNPDWRLAAAFLVIGLPIAAGCILFGAKHLHLLLNQEAAPKWAKSVTVK